MTIDFYYMPESPPCRAVELVADKLQVPLNKKSLNVAKGDHLSKEFLDINPLHCVPTIVDGDIILWESRAIIGYLVNRYASSHDTRSLYPDEPVHRARVDMMLYFDMGILYKAQCEYLGPKIRGNRQLDSVKEIKFKEALQYVDGLVSSTSYITGATLTIADISIVCGLTFSEGCDYDLTQYNHLTLYRDRVKRDLPTYDSVSLEPIARFRSYVLSRGLSLLGSSNHWKFLMADESKNFNKRPCLDSCNTTTTDIDSPEHPSDTRNIDTSPLDKIARRETFTHRS